MSYNKNTWQDSDYITTSDMNRIENDLEYLAGETGSSYTKTNWKNGDIVSASRLNNIEDGIEDIFNAIDLISTEAVLNDITPIDDNISITVNNTGKISATYRSNEDLNIINTPGVVNQNTTAHIDIYKNETYQLNTQKSSSIIPTKSQQVAVSSGKFTTGDVIIEAIPNQYIVPSGKKSITQNGTNIDVTEYEKVDVQIPSDVNNQNKTVTPTSSSQEITADSGYSGLGTVTVNAVPLGTAGTPIVNCNISNHSATITPSVTNTEGYIDSGTKTGDSVSVSASELVSGNKSISSNGTNIDVTNYATVNVSVPTSGAPVINSLSVTPSTSEQTFNSSSVDGYKPVTVAAVSSGKLISGGIYISDIVNISVSESGEITAQSGAVWLDSPVVTDGWLTSSDNIYIQAQGFDTYQLSTQAGTTVTPTTSEQTIVTAGKYTTGAIKVSAMPTGTSGTPTAIKGSVSNHSVTITPSVTNTSGYITGGTKTGTAVSVSASELVSGTYSVTSSGTKDVTNYATATIPSGTEGVPTATKGSVTNNSVNVTPSVTNTSGFITGSTKNGSPVTVSASELVSGTKSISSNGTNIDVTNYESVDVDVFSPTLEPLRVYSDNNHNDNDTIITPQTGHAFSSVKVDLDVLDFKFDVSETTPTEDSTSITFNNVFKEPFWYYVVCEDQIQFSSTNKYAFLVHKHQTYSNPCIRYIYNTTKTAYTYNASQSFNYVDSTFTITTTQSGVKFAANKKYTLVCMYNTRMYSTQSSKKEIDSSSNEFEIDYLAQRPYAIYGYTENVNTKQSSSEITSFFALIHDDYEDYNNQITNSCDGSYIITTGQLVECISDDLSVKINKEEKYGSYNYNHSITISSSNFDFKSGTWCIFYIPYNGSPGEIVKPEPLYINDSYGDGFTKNGIYYAENYGYHGFNRIQVNVPQKINYEEGVYTPQSDETNPTIYFSSDHYNPPNQIIMVDTTKYDPEDETYTPIMPKTNSNIEWGFTYYGRLGGDTRTSPEVKYGSNEDDVILATVRKTSIQSNNTYNQTSYSLTATGLDNWGDATNDYADGTKFMPHTTSSNTVWEGGRSYYWIALWAPLTAVY